MKKLQTAPVEGNTHPSPVASKTKQNISRKNHFFTFFYKNDEKAPELFKSIIEELKKFAYQGKVQSEICPSTSRPHLQGMIWCDKKHRDTEFKLLKGAHFLPLKDVDDVANYCNKDETHDGQFRACWGFHMKFTQEIENFYDWEINILDMLKSPPDDRTLHWYWEPDGCKGKTTFQKYVYTHLEDVVVLSGKAADMKNAIIEYANSNHKLPKIVLVNVPRSCLKYVSYTGLEEIKDMFFYSGKYEGGMVCGKNPHVLIFANEEPNYKTMSSDRFIVHNLKNDSHKLNEPLFADEDDY